MFGTRRCSAKVIPPNRAKAFVRRGRKLEQPSHSPGANLDAGRAEARHWFPSLIFPTTKRQANNHHGFSGCHRERRARSKPLKTPAALNVHYKMAVRIRLISASSFDKRVITSKSAILTKIIRSRFFICMYPGSRQWRAHIWKNKEMIL